MVRYMLVVNGRLRWEGSPLPLLHLTISLPSHLPLTLTTAPTLWTLTWWVFVCATVCLYTHSSWGGFATHFHGTSAWPHTRHLVLLENWFFGRLFFGTLGYLDAWCFGLRGSQDTWFFWKTVSLRDLVLQDTWFFWKTCCFGNLVLWNTLFFRHLVLQDSKVVFWTQFFGTTCSLGHLVLFFVFNDIFTPLVLRLVSRNMSCIHTYMYVVSLDILCCCNYMIEMQNIFRIWCCMMWYPPCVIQSDLFEDEPCYVLFYRPSCLSGVCPNYFI